MRIPCLFVLLMATLVIVSPGGSLNKVKGSPTTFVHSSRVLSLNIVDSRSHLQRHRTQRSRSDIQVEYSRAIAQPVQYAGSRRRLVEGWLSQEWPTNAWTYTNSEGGNREEQVIEADRYWPYTWHFPETEIRKSWDYPAVDRDRLKNINFSVWPRHLPMTSDARQYIIFRTVSSGTCTSKHASFQAMGQCVVHREGKRDAWVCDDESVPFQCSNRFHSEIALPEPLGQ